METTGAKVERFATENNKLRAGTLPITRAMSSTKDAIVTVIYALPLSEVFGELSLKTQEDIKSQLFENYGKEIFNGLCDDNISKDRD